MKNDRRFLILTLSVSLVLFELGLLLNLNVFDKSERTIANKPTLTGFLSRDFTNEHNKWAQEIENIGPGEAYDDFKNAYKDKSPGIQHEAAHLFGQILFLKVGLDGAGICDDSFAFGCYHTFLASAIEANGINVVEILNKKCIEKLQSQALGCQHGIGHGLLTNAGYDYDNLLNSLQICDNLPVNDPIGGCIGGVFMEYNFQTILGSEGRLRSFIGGDYFYPCQQVKHKYEEACLYWQSQLWGNVLPGNYNQRYAKIGGFCKGVKDVSAREQCFMGAGNTVGQFVSWDIKEAKKLCDEISAGGSIWCLAGAAGAFFAEPTTKSVALMLCDDLDSTNKQACINRSNIFQGNL